MSDLLLSMVAFAVVLFFYIVSFITHKVSCIISIKKNKLFCDCWDCKNPHCKLFEVWSKK